MRTKVYFTRPVGMSGPIKIGCTTNIENRLSSLSTWSPFPLELILTIPGDTRLEGTIHDRFARDHLHREWFSPSDGLLTFIRRVISGEDVDTVLSCIPNKPGAFRKSRRRHYPPWSIGRRERASYRSKLFWAARRLGTEDAYAIFPNGVRDIVSLYGRDVPPISDAERARLEEILSNPSAHFIMHQHRKIKAEGAAA